MDYPLSPLRFLIVDDSGNYRTSLLTLLTDAEVPSRQIDSAANGEEALKLIASNHYDVILCDFYMGEGKDGQQVLEESRARGILGYSTIFIIIAAETARAMVLSVVENRPDDYLTKPFTRSVLSSRLHKLISDKEGLREVDEALGKKSYQRAMHHLNRLIEARSECPYELLRIKADIEEKNRYYDQALQIYEETLEEQSLIWARLGKGRVLYSKERYAEALACFEQVLEENDAQNVARDWMARTLMKMDQGERAQEILEDAVEQSPRVLKRQKLLATVAGSNGDHEVAERAYKSVIRLGEHSMFRDISDFTGLSDLLMAQNAPQKALKTLKQGKKRFAGDTSAQIKSAMEEGRAYEKLGRKADVDRMLKQAMQQFEKRHGVIAPEVALELAGKLNENSMRMQADAEQADGLMAKSLEQKSDKIRARNKELLKDILSEVTQHNHNNEEIQQEIEDLVEQSDMDEEEKQSLNAARQEVVALNNDGVSLYKEGKVVEAASILYEAAERLHGNRVINLNAAQALLGMMVAQGPNQTLIERTDACLSRVPIEFHDQKYEKLRNLFEQFLNRLDQQKAD